MGVAGFEVLIKITPLPLSVAMASSGGPRKLSAPPALPGQVLTNVDALPCGGPRLIRVKLPSPRKFTATRRMESNTGFWTKQSSGISRPASGLFDRDCLSPSQKCVNENSQTRRAREDSEGPEGPKSILIRSDPEGSPPRRIPYSFPLGLALLLLELPLFLRQNPVPGDGSAISFHRLPPPGKSCTMHRRSRDCGRAATSGLASSPARSFRP